MAGLEQLVATVQDEKLRREIEAEITALKERTRFGLVYERHAGGRAPWRSAPGNASEPFSDVSLHAGGLPAIVGEYARVSRLRGV